VLGGLKIHNSCSAADAWLSQHPPLFQATIRVHARKVRRLTRPPAFGETVRCGDVRSEQLRRLNDAAQFGYQGVQFVATCCVAVSSSFGSRAKRSFKIFELIVPHRPDEGNESDQPLIASENGYQNDSSS